MVFRALGAFGGGFAQTFQPVSPQTTFELIRKRDEDRRKRQESVLDFTKRFTVVPRGTKGSFMVFQPPSPLERGATGKFVFATEKVTPEKRLKLSKEEER